MMGSDTTKVLRVDFWMMGVLDIFKEEGGRGKVEGARYPAYHHRIKSHRRKHIRKNTRAGLG